MNGRPRLVQIKTFVASDPVELDNKVNQWLKDETAKRFDTGFGTLNVNVTHDPTPTRESTKGDLIYPWLCSVTYAIDVKNANAFV